MHIAVITPIHTPDGISRYSEKLYSEISREHQVTFLANQDIALLTLPDSANVQRLWVASNKNFEAVGAWIRENKVDMVHIQAHPEYFPPASLAAILKEIEAPKVIVTMHSFGPWHAAYANILNQPKVTKVLIHNPDAIASELIQSTQLKLFPLGYDTYPRFDKQELRQVMNIEDSSPVIVTHGLITESKGLLETAEAVKILTTDFPKISWLAANALNANNPVSAKVANQLKKQIAKLGQEHHITLITDFLSSAAVAAIIQAADIGVLPYQEVGEGASAAARKFISCGIPTIVTNIPVMQEFTTEVYKIADNSPAVIAEGIRQLWGNEMLRTDLSQNSAATAERLNWPHVAAHLIQIYNS